MFERHHRFIGWLGLAVCSPISLYLLHRYSFIRCDLQTTWVFVVLGNSYDVKLGKWRTNANTLLSAQELWFAAFMTIL